MTKVFESYKLIAKLSGKIKTKSPMRIGAGRGVEVLESDLPIVKNSDGIPIIPGSSLKGFFRGNLQRILYMKFSNGVDNLLNEIFGGKENERASAVLFHELKADEYKISERKHIAIDPEKGSVRRGGLFDIECVMDGSVFSGILFTTRNLSPKGLALLKTVIDATNLGLTKLGGFKSRGYGSIEIELDELKIILPGSNVNELSKGKIIDGLIPTGEKSCLELNTTEFKIDGSKVTIDGVEFEAQIKEAPSFFGLEIIVKDEQISKLFDGLLKVIT